MIHRRYSLGLRLSYLLALLAHDATESEALTLVNICPDGIFWTTIPAMTDVGVGAFIMTTPPSQRGAAAAKTTL
jgi:hypothetical protein